MKLYIKQQVFSWKDRFTVKNEYGEDAYAVEGEVFSLGKKLHVYDTGGSEAAYIEQKLLSFRPRYYIHIGGEVFEMVKDITLFRHSYHLAGLPYQLQGDFLAHEYSLLEAGTSLMRVYKEWFAWGDSYALDIADAHKALLCLCMVLVVDCAMDGTNNG